MPIQAFELELDLENITKQILEIDACCFFLDFFSIFVILNDDSLLPSLRFCRF